jgi:hypothetical protein
MQLYVFRDQSWHSNHVIVQKKADSAAGLRGSSIPGGSSSGLWLFKDSERKWRAKGIQHGSRIVGRAVQDNDNLEVLRGMLLAKQRIKTRAQSPSATMARNDDTQFDRRHCLQAAEL